LPQQFRQRHIFLYDVQQLERVTPINVGTLLLMMIMIMQ
jgi:hypothetical protein